DHRQAILWVEQNSASSGCEHFCDRLLERLHICWRCVAILPTGLSYSFQQVAPMIDCQRRDHSPIIGTGIDAIKFASWNLDFHSSPLPHSDRSGYIPPLCIPFFAPVQVHLQIQCSYDTQAHALPGYVHWPPGSPGASLSPLPPHPLATFHHVDRHSVCRTLPG